jgi:hypothetical protein
LSVAAVLVVLVPAAVVVQGDIYILQTRLLQKTK